MIGPLSGSVGGLHNDIDGNCRRFWPGLAGTARYDLTPACRDELAALAAIAECADVLLEEPS